SMFSNSSDFDSSLDATALQHAVDNSQELSNDGSSDVQSSGSKNLNTTSEISSLFAYTASWNTLAAVSDAGKTRELQEEEECYIDNRIYISNIPFSYTSVDLEKIFSSYGKVVAAQVVTNERGSKGFGFVTLDTAVACDLARVQLDGTVMGGRKIEVKKARQMQHNRATSVGLAKNGNTRSLLSPSLLYPETSSLLPTLVGNNNLHGALAGQSNGTSVQLLAQLQLAQLQSMQTAHFLNMLASQPIIGSGLGQLGYSLQNPLLNSLMNPLGVGGSPINPFGLDTNALLRQNANLGGLIHPVVNQSDTLSSLFPPVDVPTLDALSRPGGNLF
ncbi:hypothetical protein PMAYCL1PPCAC_06609, partial [Pristionchus mayeri]